MTRGRGPLAAIALGGLVAGALDLVYAFVQAGVRGRPPLRVLHSIASGLLGKDSYDGGVLTGAVGLLCHFTIALGGASVYYLASRRLSLLRHRPVVSGLVFGICVYLVMNFVVLPLSAVPFTITHTPASFAWGFASHALLVGLPIALATRRFGGTPTA